jgi:hypothetical protein
MNLSTKILIVILIFIGAMPSFSQDCTAAITIKSDIENATVFINDSFLGKGSEIKTELKTGNYKIEVNDCSEIILNYSFNNKVLINSEPENAYVFINDSLVGFTPLLLSNKFETLNLEKPDYKSKKVSLSEIKSNEKIKLDFTGEDDNESFYESTIFKILVGTAVALGASTAYFKLEADKRFDEYKVTGDPELLNQTDRLDVISGVTFVALQINFGLIIYLFLSD